MYTPRIGPSGSCDAHTYLVSVPHVRQQRTIHPAKSHSDAENCVRIHRFAYEICDATSEPSGHTHTMSACSMCIYACSYIPRACIYMHIHAYDTCACMPDMCVCAQAAGADSDCCRLQAQRRLMSTCIHVHPHTPHAYMHALTYLEHAYTCSRHMCIRMHACQTCACVHACRGLALSSYR